MKILTYNSIVKISRSQWTQLIGDHFPFSEYEYLLAMETGKCVGAGAGWQPQYITAWEDNTLVGAIYLYIKTNSYGEYIFDWAWANAYAQNGFNYYPKLVSAVPFTPATGKKLLFHPSVDRDEVATLLLNHVSELAYRQECSSIHFLFIDQSEIPFFEKNGFFIRHSYQFHWHNQGYTDFDEFLSALKGKRRKEIIRERRKVEESPARIHCLTGDDLKSVHCESMYELYLSTIYKMGAIDYLTFAFFEKIFTTMKDKVVLFMAEVDQKWVAGAINYRKGNCMYGRYWGCFEEYKNLHFELCYYRAIDYAIQHKIGLFEAGAQGEHKIQRGFLPQTTLSAHLMQNPQFHDAIEDFCIRERIAITQSIRDSDPHMPYKT